LAETATWTSARAHPFRELAHPAGGFFSWAGQTHLNCDASSLRLGTAIAENHAIPTRFSYHLFARTPQAEDKVRGRLVKGMKKCLSDYSPDFILGISLRALVAARRAGPLSPGAFALNLFPLNAIFNPLFTKVDDPRKLEAGPSQTFLTPSRNGPKAQGITISVPAFKI
jgi:hypothetical protein